jgi:hypothetical protein
MNIKGKYRLRLAIKLMLVIVLFSLLPACSLLHSSPQRKTEKKQEQASKMADKEYEKAKKMHLKNQNKQTQKMMKRTKKRSTGVNSSKKRGLFAPKKCN